MPARRLAIAGAALAAALTLGAGAPAPALRPEPLHMQQPRGSHPAGGGGPKNRKHAKNVRRKAVRKALRRQEARDRAGEPGLHPARVQRFNEMQAAGMERRDVRRVLNVLRRGKKIPSGAYSVETVNRARKIADDLRRRDHDRQPK